MKILYQKKMQPIMLIFNKKDGIKGGHIIILNAGGSEFFKEIKKAGIGCT